MALTRTGQIPANPAAEIDLPKDQTPATSCIDGGRVLNAIMALVDISTVIGLRDRAMMEVLYGTGMRRMELANLEIGDIDIDQCVVLIREGKGRKDPPHSTGRTPFLGAYLNKSRPELHGNLQEKPLFSVVKGALKPCLAIHRSPISRQTR